MTHESEKIAGTGGTGKLQNYSENEEKLIVVFTD
jgi:hypothetical protein